MWIKNVFYAFIMFCVVSSSFLLIQSDLGTEYGITIDEDMSEDYDRIDNITQKINSMGGTMYDAEHTQSNEFNPLSKENIKGMKLIFELPELAWTLISITGERIGIPALFLKAGIAVISITIFLFFIAFVWKRGWGE